MVTVSREYAHIGIEHGVEANVTGLELESLEQTVDVVVPHLRDERLVGIDPHASHARLLSHVGLAVEPAVLA